MKKGIIIAIVSVVAIVALIVGGIVFWSVTAPTRTVRNFLKDVQEANVDEMFEAIDVEGFTAFFVLMDDEADMDNFEENFDDEYEDAKDGKGDYSEFIDDIEGELDYLREDIDEYIDDIEIEYEIANIKSSKVKDSKYLTRVDVEIDAEVTYEGQTEKETFEIGLYTIKKGMKVYLVGLDIDDVQDSELLMAIYYYL